MRIFNEVAEEIQYLITDLIGLNHSSIETDRGTSEKSAVVYTTLSPKGYKLGYFNVTFEKVNRFSEASVTYNPLPKVRISLFGVTSGFWSDRSSMNRISRQIYKELERFLEETYSGKYEWVIHIPNIKM